MQIALPVLSSAHLIATPEYPLRASALPKLNDCPASVFLQQEFWLRGDDDAPGGEAAQTGNLVHSGAAAFHLEKGTDKQREEAARAALEAARAKFPGGDPKKAKRHLEAYIADPENKEAEVLEVEKKVTCTLPCAPFDKTGQPIIIRGTMDQLRMVDGVKRVDDIKTGSWYYGYKALDHYRTQQAAYVIGAQQTFNDPTIEPGALICTEGYFKEKDLKTGKHRVFWYHDWGFEDIPLILQNVVTQVAAARMGYLNFSPTTDACKWCEHKRFKDCTAFYKDHTT